MPVALTASARVYGLRIFILRRTSAISSVVTSANAQYSKGLSSLRPNRRFVQCSHSATIFSRGCSGMGGTNSDPISGSVNEIPGPFTIMLIPFVLCEGASM